MIALLYMDNLAKKLINDHRNPIVKVEVSSSKLFLKTSTPKETEHIEKHQANLQNILSHERAERRCARSQAVWSPADKLAKVTKAVKTLTNFGYRDKNGTYLHPEETLFLMETNRLEVTFNEVPLSIQEGYDLLLKSCDLLRYKVYKKLVLQGYKLLRHSELHKRLLKTVEHEINSKSSLSSEVQSSVGNRKRTTNDENDIIEPKKNKLMPRIEQEASVSNNASNLPGESKNSKQLELLQINNIFERLRDNTPREYTKARTEDAVPDYCVFLPTNKSRCDYDFNLYICEDLSFMKQDNYATPALFAICSKGNVSFYKFSQVKLPFL